MAEPFKLLLSPALAAACAEHLTRVWRDFDQTRFQRCVEPGFDALEMKARAMRIADALEATLPADFDRACTVIEAALGPPGAGDALSELRTGPMGLAGWIVWPLGEFIARRGLDQPVRALAALHALTQRFSAEWAIRPFLIRHPALVYATLERWVADPSAHVRRLVSEGSRPRLPWGMQLRAAITDPSPALPLLKVLQDDPSAYVRRSVANHLNDIGKDHPELLAQWLESHLPGASPARAQMLRHASRSLVKAGHVRTLAAFGLTQGFVGTVALVLSAKHVHVGAGLTLDLTLHAPPSAPAEQALVVDYAVHFRKANGSLRPKVFKGWTLTLAAGETRTLRRQLRFQPVTTRVLYPGRQGLDVRVNGVLMQEAAFELLA